MKYRATTRVERPLHHQAIAYLLHGLVFILLALLSGELWVVLLCALLFCITAGRAFQLFASVIENRDLELSKRVPKLVDISR